MQLTNIERHRVLEIFDSKAFYCIKNKYEVVCRAAKLENIRITSSGLGKLIKRYKTNGFVKNKTPLTSNLMITKRGLLAINRSLLKNSFLTAKNVKNTLVLVASRRSVTRYISKLG